MTGALERLRAALADRYAIERELGQGGMATVYLAEDLKHHRKVAIKILKPELAASLGAGRFLREIETTAQLTHPHILPLLDSGGQATAEGEAALLYYVMPYVEGESLRDRMEREKQLPLGDALRIAREVAEALAYAHGHGVIHRDIKPENILLESGHAVVADFGIARAVSAAGAERLTETGLTVGTPAYMSPEQAAGSRDVDGRSDVYSLGCVLYEMLGGEPPYIGHTPQAILAKKLSEPMPRISVIRDTVTPGIEAAVRRALARTPADRWATAAEFAEALAHPDTVETAVAAARRPWWRRRAASLAAGAAALALLLGGFALGRHLLAGRTGPRQPHTAIAVLPFENLSGAGPHSYFASGLHDELLTQLSKVATLSVRARTSVMGYAGTTKSIRRIGEELGVGSVVEGSVQIDGNRLRVNVQLIDAATDQHVWAERYDSTLSDAFAVQSDIAQRIVAAVGATLTTAEAGAIAAAPTRNANAYRLYLQGLGVFRRPAYLRENLEAAQRLLDSAIALDPAFALAHATLSTVHGQMHWFRYDPSPARAALQRREAEEALRLAPTLPRAHVAMGDAWYSGQRDYRRALQEYDLALQGMPNDADLWRAIAAAQRRLGNWDSVEVAVARGLELDPRNLNMLVDLGAGSYAATRRYADAVRMLERARSVAPGFRFASFRLAMVVFQWKGELDSLRAFVGALRPDDDVGGGAGAVREVHADLLLWERQPDSLLLLLRSMPTAVLDRQESYHPRALYAAWAQLLRRDSAAARAAFDSAATLLDSVGRVLPGDYRVHAARGQALAGLGRRRDALSEVDWLKRSLVYRTDRSEGPFVADEIAQILARVGERDSALAELERILSGPSWTTSVHTLRFDARWDPLRSDPRFAALLRKYGG